MTPVSRPTVALLGGVFGAVIALALIAGALALEREPIRQWLLAEDRQHLAQLDQREEDLAARLAAPAAAAAIPDDVDHRLNQMDDKIEQLRRAMPPEGMILRLTERTEQAERNMREIAQSQAATQALLLTVGQLREAVNRGDSFATELVAVRRLLSGEDLALLNGLNEGAAIPRQDQLLRRFQPLTRQLLDQENAARGNSLLHIIGRNLQKVIMLRRMDGKGNDAEAVLGRTEAALSKDDWEQAIAEMHGLPGPFAATAESWLQQAEARLAADRALSRLSALAAARSAGR